MCSAESVCGITITDEVLCWGHYMLPVLVKSPTRSFDDELVVTVSPAGDDTTCGSTQACATLAGALATHVAPRTAFEVLEDVTVSWTLTVDHFLASIRGNAGGGGGVARIVCNVTSGAPCIAVVGTRVTLENLEIVSSVLDTRVDFVVLDMVLPTATHDTVTVRNCTFRDHVSSQPVLRFGSGQAAR